MPTKDSRVLTVRIKGNLAVMVEDRIALNGMTKNQWLTWAIEQGLRKHSAKDSGGETKMNLTQQAQIRESHAAPVQHIKTTYKQGASKCPRCGGQLIISYGELVCLQCGHNPTMGR